MTQQGIIQPDLQHIYLQFNESPQHVTRFIEDGTKILKNRKRALQIAQYITSVACLHTREQDLYISNMITAISPPKVLREAIINTATQLKSPPQRALEAAQQLIPTITEFTQHLDKPPENPKKQGENVYLQVRADIQIMHQRHIHSIAATFVNYSVTDETDKQQFIKDISQHLERRNAAIILIAKTCRAVMHMNFQPLESKIIIRLRNDMEQAIETVKRQNTDSLDTNQEEDIKLQANAITNAITLNYCTQAMESATKEEKEQQIEMTSFWHQVMQNLP